MRRSTGVFCVILLAGCFLFTGIASGQDAAGILYNVREVYPVFLFFFDNGSQGTIRSVQTGCAVPEYTCPFSERTRLNCTYDGLNPDGIGDCLVWFRGGTLVTLQAFSAAGSVFAGFNPALMLPEKEGPGFNNTRIQVLGARPMEAMFVPAGTRFEISAVPQTFSAPGEDIAGARIVSNPAAINCTIGPDGNPVVPDDCFGQFAPGTTVRLTAIAGNAFNRVYGYDSFFPWTCSEFTYYSCTFPINGWLFP